MIVSLESLRNFLLDARLVLAVDFDSVATEAGQDTRRVEDLLISRGLITEDDLRRAKSYILGIPFVDLSREKIVRDVLNLIPEPVARRHNIVSYKRAGDTLEVAMLDPLDLQAIDFIKKGTGLKILARLTSSESIKNVLVQYQKSLKSEFGDLIQKETLALKNRSQASPEEEESSVGLKKLAEDVPVVRIVDLLLSHAVSQKASDIHIEPYEDELVIRYRIDGLLHDAMVLPKETASGIVARIKVLANLRLDEKRLPQDGRFKTNQHNEQISYRVSTLPTQFGEKIVMRLLPDSAHGLSLEAVGFHGQGLDVIERVIKRTTGLILVTGPTGSGKSTTLYAILDILNTPDVNISTIEDPIEYQVKRINQTQVRPDIGLTFASGLRTLVRQDPDIIMVGEIRDKETVGLAVNAALTGHLVLSTLHTNSATGTIPRLLDLGAEPFLVVSTLEVVVAQRLVRRLTESKEAYNLNASELKELGNRVDLDKVLLALKAEHIVSTETTWENIKFYKPKVTNDDDGYSGRVAIMEVLSLTPSLRDLIIQGATGAQLNKQARSEGMLTMLEDGLFKAVQGLTSIEEVLGAVTE